MRRSRFACLSLAGLVVALAAAGCGGSSAVTGPEEGAAPTGNAVLQGGIQGAGFAASSAGGVGALSGGSGMRVSAVGTSVAAEADDEGRFVLAGLPAGSVTLRFEGGGIDARLEVSGLQAGQVTSIEVQLSGGGARMTSAPTCTPTAETRFSGLIESISGTRLVVAGRPVDASEVKKVWRGDRRIPLSDLQVGEKVKVWGTLRGDGVVMAEEIQALSSGSGPGSETWVSFKGRVESVSHSALDVHANPTGGGSYPTLQVAGRKVKTTSSTKFKWSDGTALDPKQIQTGDQASVGGWLKPEGYVLAATLVIDCR